MTPTKGVLAKRAAESFRDDINFSAASTRVERTGNVTSMYVDGKRIATRSTDGLRLENGNNLRVEHVVNQLNEVLKHCNPNENTRILVRNGSIFLEYYEDESENAGEPQYCMISIEGINYHDVLWKWKNPIGIK